MSRAPRRRLEPEKVTFIAALAILVALVAAIVFLWVEHRDPAILAVRQVGALRVDGEQSYLTARVTNDGDETARAVQVLVEVTLDGEIAAEGEQTVDVLSGGEDAMIVFILRDVDPRAETTLRVASYSAP